MISVNIICIGTLKEKYFTDAVAEYSKRLGGFCRFKITQLDEYKLPQNPGQAQINTAVCEEGKKILQKLSKGGYTVAMCIEGRQLSSPELAALLDDVPLKGYSNVDFIIGGSYGLSEDVKKASDLKLSMSKLTFPHQLARVMLCEQIYRAFQISCGGKYHK